MRFGLFFLITASTGWSGEATLLWRDPGSIASLDLAAGPGGKSNAPVAPFQFVEEETSGVQPKAVVTDARKRKWMVKFGEEAKSENLASRIAWAAGYPVRANYFVQSGKIQGMPTSGQLAKFISPQGEFQAARFQKFDDDTFRQVAGGKLNLADRREDQRELNGLKLTALLLSNWDVKTANSAEFEIDGARYRTISDWGASLGDVRSQDRVERKWNCEAYKAQTERLMDGFDGEYVQFNYAQYSGRHEDSLSEGIKIDDVKWYMNRMQHLSAAQIKSAALASGASAQDASCFAGAIENRLKLFADAGNRKTPVKKTVTTTTTTTKQ